MGERIKAKKLDLLNGPIWSKIPQFALPVAATGILEQLFNASDIAIVGNFASTDRTVAIAAVGANSPIIGMILNLFIGISLGTNVVIANAIGRRDDIRIYLVGMPVIFLYNFEAAIFRSVGDTKVPLQALALSGMLNVVLNLFFVVLVGRCGHCHSDFQCRQRPDPVFPSASHRQMDPAATDKTSDFRGVSGTDSADRPSCRDPECRIQSGKHRDPVRHQQSGYTGHCGIQCSI